MIEPKLVWFLPSFPSLYAWFSGISPYLMSLNQVFQVLLELKGICEEDEEFGAKRLTNRWNRGFSLFEQEKSPHSRHGDRRVAKTIRWVTIWGRHSDPLLQMATSHFISWSPFEVAIATHTCKRRPHRNSNLGMVAILSPWGRHGDRRIHARSPFEVAMAT